MGFEVKAMTDHDVTTPIDDLEAVEPDVRRTGSDPGPAACCVPVSRPPGYLDNKQAHLRRLRRIEGQTRGLQRMIENDEYCIDVLTQISAVTSALKSVSLLLLEEHLNHCVAHAVQNGGEEADAKLAEANAAIARLLRS